MRNTLKLISSPRNLFIFEAAARLGSFTLASDELGMQQPSVSAAIKQLEGSLGVRLFDRGHRRISLTNAGLRLRRRIPSTAWHRKLCRSSFQYGQIRTCNT